GAAPTRVVLRAEGRQPATLTLDGKDTSARYVVLPPAAAAPAPAAAPPAPAPPVSHHRHHEKKPSGEFTPIEDSTSPARSKSRRRDGTRRPSDRKACRYASGDRRRLEHAMHLPCPCVARRLRKGRRSTRNGRCPMWWTRNDIREGM